MLPKVTETSSNTHLTESFGENQEIFCDFMYISFSEKYNINNLGKIFALNLKRLRKFSPRLRQRSLAVKSLKKSVLCSEDVSFLLRRKRLVLKFDNKISFQT